MPRKRGPARRSDTLKRKKRFEKDYSHHTVPLWFKKTLPQGAALLADWLTNQEELEKQVFAQLETDGVDTALWVYYAAFARRLFSKCLRFSDLTYASEKTSLQTEFQLRDLDSTVLEHVINIVDAKCRVVKGIVVTLQDIEDKLDHAEWGLAALKALFDVVEGKLDDGTTGLAALKALIDATEAKLDEIRPWFGAGFITNME